MILGSSNRRIDYSLTGKLVACPTERSMNPRHLTRIRVATQTHVRGHRGNFENSTIS